MAAIVFYVSGHGFGHASRQIELINTLAACRPDIDVAVRTSAPPWLFDLTLRRPADVEEVEVDTGVVQIDSLRLDEPTTLQRAWEFHRQLEVRAAAEAALLRHAKARLVVGDIPPLAFAAAAQAGLPAVAVANFTWDWIYEGCSRPLASTPGLIAKVRRAYATATLACRLPLCGGFRAFARQIDVPFIARRSQRLSQESRRALGLPIDRPLVLISFGRYAPPALNRTVLAALGRYGVVTVDDLEPASAPLVQEGSIFRLNERCLHRTGLHYEDLVAAVDVVVTKPGYGIVSECIANETALLYTSRGHFVEYDVLVSGMPRFLRCAYLDQDELVAGRWTEHLDRLLAQPQPPERPRTDGAEVVAALLLKYLG